MTRKECLDAAAKCVLKDRQNQYGKPEDSFGMIARMWGAYLGVCVSAHDVAAMMALLKIARFRHNPFHEDNAVDLAGYAACMAETATAWEREGEEDGVRVESHWPDFVEKKKAEGCEDLVVSPFDAPQTPDAVCRHIVDCNPSVFKSRTPTGEELAEMAEEDAHG